jgi:5S rRNA maturation endonuclease (ribonuclease M5)
MDFEFKPTVSKSFLKDRNSQEVYFEYYLGVHVKKGLFRSPSCIRSDNHPTCCFYKNKSGNLIYKDFAGPSFDFVGCVMYLYKCSYARALRIIANDFGYVKYKDVPVNECKVKEFSGTIIEEVHKSIINVKIKDYSEKELDWWNSFGVTRVTLNKYKVYSIDSVYLNNEYFCSSTPNNHIFGYYGGINMDGEEQWKIYFPTKRKYRFMTNWSSTILQGSKVLPKKSDYIIITKSMKDVMCLHEFGLQAIAPNSENIIISDAKFKRIQSKYKNVFVLMDNDLPGVKGAHKYKKKFNIKCIFIKRRYSKDISDLHKKIAESSFWKAIEELESITKNNNPSKYFYVF